MARGDIGIAQAQVAAQLGLRRVAREVARAVDVAVADPVRQRDAPGPAAAQRGGGGLRRDGAAVVGRGQRHRRVVVQVAGERQEAHAQGLLQQQRAESGRVDVEVGLDAAPVLRVQCADRAVLGLLDPRHRALEVAHAAPGGPIAQELADQHRVEVVAVVDAERELVGRQRRQPSLRQRGIEEIAVWMRPHVGIAPAQHGVEEVGRRAAVVEVVLERMVVGGEAGARRPAARFDRGLVGGVAARHPFRFGDAQHVEEGAQLRRRALAHADDADLRRLEHGQLQRPAGPALRHQAGRHPAGGATAQHDDAQRLPGLGALHRHRTPDRSPAGDGSAATRGAVATGGSDGRAGVRTAAGAGL